MPPIIEVKNISKQYRIAHQRGGYIALRDVLTNAIFHPLRFLKKKAQQKFGAREDFWALKDISFTVEPGEVVGIIGANGAGKSTLLKILSRITPPSDGEIRIRGRVASLLEVGTGFHPELTGRENIFLNGAIIGMGRREIARKFDQIVQFAGVEKFIDTPVKHYSSGMYVRLAFSVAAHMDPDVLIVDEVLAVGDAEFQKKSLAKMDEATKTAGRTILFVSHNMSIVQQLCHKVVLLEHGRIAAMGPTSEMVALYLKKNPLSQTGTHIKDRQDRKGKGDVKLTSFSVTNEKNDPVEYLETGGRYTFNFQYESKDEQVLENLNFVFVISNETGTNLIYASSRLTGETAARAPAHGTISCKFTHKLPLMEGIYFISTDLFVNGERQDHIKNMGIFEVKEGDYYGTKEIQKHSPINVEQTWSFNQK
ncbi:MAG TPA: ABC transporter ATP-binding protein [Candidatus Paceibacterota bacterium]|nr:ABC transporter ATP-binding protein [Candidatus Paceibacterota bacterium]